MYMYIYIYVNVYIYIYMLAVLNLSQKSVLDSLRRAP